MKAGSDKIAEMQLSSERNLLALNRDLVQVRSDLASLIDLVKNSQALAAPAAPVVLQEPVGYLTEIGEREVKFKIDAGRAVRAGMRLGVYPAADPNTQIGILVVSEVVDANNAKAEIIRKDSGATFNFSDIVRPIS